MFFMDPIYILVFVVGLILVLLPQLYVTRTYKKYLKVAASSGLTGAEVAAEILRQKGFYGSRVAQVGEHTGGVRIEATSGILSDHYDPTQNVLRLSKENYYGKSISAIAVAAHEAGHAIQQNEGYFPIKIRSAFFPIASIGDKLGIVLILIGFFAMFWMGMVGAGQMFALAGMALYLAVVIFQVITLPVEFDASGRALSLLRETGILAEREVGYSRKVLTAAALTYVATALYAIMNLLYYVYLFFGRRD